MIDLGDRLEDSTINFCWHTNGKDGSRKNRTTDGTIQIYKDNSLTQITAGITDIGGLGGGFDGITGLNLCTIDTSASASYSTGSDYSVILQGAVIDGENVTACLATFSIENREVTVGTNNDKTGYSLANGSITSTTYDRSTAFAVGYQDSGITTIARVGSPGTDTLGSLSIQLDSCSTHSANDVTGGTTVAQAESNIRGPVPGTDTLATLSTQLDSCSTHSANDVTGGTTVAAAESNIRGGSDTLGTLSDQLDGIDPLTSGETTAACSTAITNNFTFASGDVVATLDGESVTVGTNSDKTGYGLADNAITSAKYDEFTAFPLKAADSGSTYLARTGAASDTLETLSDQLDGINPLSAAQVQAECEDAIDAKFNFVSGDVVSTLSGEQVTVGTNNDKNNYTLANSSITGAKFDSITAFPIALQDAGANAIARRGGNGTLSLDDLYDQINGLNDLSSLGVQTACETAINTQFSFTSGLVKSDVTRVSTSATAADNLERICMNAMGADYKILISTNNQDLNSTFHVDAKAISGSTTAADNVEANIGNLDASVSTVDTVVDAIKLKTDNLPETIKKNTALNNFPFLMVDVTDGYTPETGLSSITAQRSIDGGAFSSCTNSPSEVANGWYKINLSESDLNGDIIILRFEHSSARDNVMSLKTTS